MLKLALISFMVSLVSDCLGFSGVSSTAARVARVLFFVALAMFVGSVALALLAGSLVL